MAQPNWLIVNNPYGLAKPPDWWLQQLTAQDPDLVMFPSQQQPCFRLARRVRHTAGIAAIKSVALLDRINPDTQTYGSHNLVPVTSFVPWTQWTLEIFEYLKSRDTWTVGGGAKAADILDYKDLHQTMRDERAYEDERDMLSGSAYRAAKHRMGQTVFVHK